MCRTSAALALLAVSLTGCPEPEQDGPPCDEDLTQCSDDTTKFVEDPTCELSGELEVELGEGEDSFTVLDAGEQPQTYSGFQGGQHVWLGVRVSNADLERPLLKILVRMQYCDADCDDPASWQIDNVRQLVADPSTMTTTSEGWFEVSSMLVQVYNWQFASSRRVEMIVTDPCGRQGLIVH